MKALVCTGGSNVQPLLWDVSFWSFHIYGKASLFAPSQLKTSKGYAILSPKTLGKADISGNASVYLLPFCS